MDAKPRVIGHAGAAEPREERARAPTSPAGGGSDSQVESENCTETSELVAGDKGSRKAASAGSAFSSWQTDACAAALTLCVALLALALAGAACSWLGARHSYGSHTRAQVTLAIACCGVLAAWLAAEVQGLVLAAARPAARSGKLAAEPRQVELGGPPGAPPAAKEARGRGAPEGLKDAVARGAPLLSQGVAPLRASAEVAAVLALVYACDRTNLVPTRAKLVDSRAFWGVWLLISVAAVATVRTIDASAPLAREQTDEWKGWMQIMFLLYHYFHQANIYNAIRVYIAAYVWMTGYGNFFLYAKGKSFTTRRTLQMLFRLNFLAVVLCAAVNNEYMLYYICAMHTFFTVTVILPLYIAQSVNTSFLGMHLKLAVVLACTLLLYDGPKAVFRSIFGIVPLWREFFAFHDPLHPEFTNDLHEWHFRSGLDRFIWIIGMLCAFHVGRARDAGMGRWSYGAALALAATAAAWACLVFPRDKFAYNWMHPFTSWVPVLAFLVLRNATDWLRRRYLWLFAYLGRVTLETYMLQFHVWMKTTGVNGSPKYLLEIIPGNFVLNFVAASALFVFLSVRVSHATVAIRDALIPASLADTAWRWAALSTAVAICWLLSFVFLPPAGTVPAGVSP